MRLALVVLIHYDLFFWLVYSCISLLVRIVFACVVLFSVVNVELHNTPLCLGKHCPSFHLKVYITCI